MNGASGHELRFDDTPGHELLAINSAGDYTLTVNNDLQQTTQGNEAITLKADYLLQLLEGEFSTQAKSIEINVGGSQLKLDSSGVSVQPAGKIQLLADGVPAAQPVARVGDTHQCPKIHPYLVPHVGGPIMKGSKVVMIDNLPAARVGDPMQCVGGKSKIKKGAKHILVDNKPLAFATSQSDHSGIIIKGSATTFVGKSQPIPAVSAAPEPKQTVLKADDIADIIYDVATNEFYALTVEQLEGLLATADPVMSSLDKLNESVNKDVDPKDKHALNAHQKAIVAAKAEVNKNMKGMANGADDIKITELVHFVGKDPTVKNKKGKYPWLNRKHTYVQSDKMKNHWRSYRIDKDFKKNSRIEKMKQFHEKMKDPSTGKISHKKVLHAAAKAMHIKPQSLTMASFNTEAAYKTFAGTVGNKNFNASGSASLFRATASGTVSRSYDKKTGKLSYSADGSAEADLMAATGSFTASIPSRLGFAINVQLPKTADLTGAYQRLNLGNVRVDFKVTVSAFVGATVAGSANLNLTLLKTPGSKNQAIKLHGNNKPSPTTKYAAKTTEKADADKNGLTTNVNAFAGAKASGEVSALIRWQNPDNAEANKKDLESVTEGKPIKELTSVQQAAAQKIEDKAWCDFGSIDVGGSAAIGAGANLGFSVGFQPQEGKFYLRAHAEIVCGAGLSGDIGFEILTKHIIEFVAFVYHKIKDQNFSFVGLFEEAAFMPFINFFTRYLLSDFQSLETVAENELHKITNWWATLSNDLVTDSEKLLENAEQAASNINRNPKIILQYTLPEIKGRFLYLFTQPDLQNKIEQQANVITSEMDYGIPYSQQNSDNLAVAQAQEIQQAIIYILSYIQTDKDFDNVIQHMTYDGSKLDAAQVAQRKQALYDGLGFYGRYQARKDPHVNALVKELRDNRVLDGGEGSKVLYQSKVKPNTPVEQNHGVSKYV